MKDELNCSYNGGGDAYLLQSVAIHFNHTVVKLRTCKGSALPLCPTNAPGDDLVSSSTDSAVLWVGMALIPPSSTK